MVAAILDLNPRLKETRADAVDHGQLATRELLEKVSSILERFIPFNAGNIHEHSKEHSRMVDGFETIKQAISELNSLAERRLFALPDENGGHMFLMKELVVLIVTAEKIINGCTFISTSVDEQGKHQAIKISIPPIDLSDNTATSKLVKTLRDLQEFINDHYLIEPTDFLRLRGLSGDRKEADHKEGDRKE